MPKFGMDVGFQGESGSRSDIAKLSGIDPKPTFDVLHFLSRLPGELPNCVPIMKGWNYIRPALPPAGRSSRRQVEISGG